MHEHVKRQGLVVIIGLSVIPSLFLLSLPNFAQIGSIALWLADALGYAGIVLLLWMYALGAKSVLTLVFTDIAPVLSIHKKLGKYGTLFIFLHPILVTFSYGQSWFYSFVPNVGNEFERAVTLGRIAIFILILTWSVSWFLKKRMAFRPWKYLHYLAYIAVPFALLHVPHIGSNYLSTTQVRIYFFVLVILFLIFTLLRLRGWLNLDKQPYEIVRQLKLTSVDYALQLKPLGAVVTPRRGQYIYLKTGIISEDHPFSVLQFSSDDDDLIVGYRVFGSYTKHLSTLQPGQKVYVGGAYGSFMHDYDENTQPSVFISGGIGITPFFDQIYHGYSRREQWLFAANRTRELAVFTPNLAHYLGSRLVNVYDSEPGELMQGEERGFITAELLTKYLVQPQLYTFYLCGPPPMMKAMTRTLASLGIPKEQIFTEKFGW